MMDAPKNPYEIAYERERQARQLAERLLDEKTREIYKHTQTIESQYNQLKSTYQTLLSTQNQLVEAEKLASLGRLAAGVAHEINNPIGFIRSNFSTLSEMIADLEVDTNSPAVQELISDGQEIISDCQAGFNRIKDIVQSLMTYEEAAEDGKQKTTAKSIKEIFDEVLLKYPFDHTKIEFQEEWEQLALHKVTDPNGFKRCLDAVINNAHFAIYERYQKEKSASTDFKGIIGLKLDIQPKSIQITISDNGVGIAAENLEKVYDPFFSTRDVGAGTGLGLSVAQQTLRLRKGDISISSQENVGTIVTITIPNETASSGNAYI